MIVESTLINVEDGINEGVGRFFFVVVRKLRGEVAKLNITT